MAVDDFYIHRAVVKQTATTASIYGGQTQATTVREQNVPCRMVPIRLYERAIAAQLGTIIDYRMYCPSRTRVGPHNEIVFSGRTFRVVGGLDPHETGRFMRLDLVEVKDAG